MKSPYPWVGLFLLATHALMSYAASGWPAVLAALVALKSGALAVLAATKKGKRLYEVVNDAGACGALALVFVFHGWPKVASMGADAMGGIPAGVWLFVGLVETLGGVLMIVGPMALRLLASLGLMAVMATAILTVHMGAGFNALAPGDGGFEFQLILLLLAHGVYIRSGGWSPVFEAYKAWINLPDEAAEAATLF